MTIETDPETGKGTLVTKESCLGFCTMHDQCAARIECNIKFSKCIKDKGLDNVEM